jgi:signal transduction histidine kinase
LMGQSNWGRNVVSTLRWKAPGPWKSSVEGAAISWSVLARWTWVALVVAVTIRVAATIRIFFLEVRTPCVAQTCPGPPAMTRQQMHLLHGAGVSPQTYAALCAAVLVCFIFVNCAVAGVIMWRRLHDPMAVLTGFTLVLFGGFSLGLPDQLFHQWEPAWWLPMAVLAMLGSVAIVTFVYLFPDGCPVPRWPRMAVVVWGLIQGVMYFAPGLQIAMSRLVGPASTLIAAAVQFGVFAALIYAQVYRYRRVSTPLQREQTKWVVYAITVTIVSWVGLLTFWNVSDINAGRDNPLVDFATWTAGTLLWLVIPLSIGAAILRYRLWDIDILINRTLVYAALTAMVVGVYALTIGYLGMLFRSGANLVVSLVATGVVAVLFQPAREWLQRSINRLMYGERDEPYAVLSRLGQRLEATVAPEAALASIVETIAQALKLPYAEIGVQQDGAFVTAAAFGTPVSSSLHLPLTYQQEPVGELIVGPRGRGELFTPADRRLLDDIARQVEVAVHAARVTAALQRSRERLVTAREEERRRLRRDLHDGLGPALASMLLQAETAHDLVRSNPRESEALLTGLVDQLSTATTDIRRLVYNLRPPALDDLGLLGAIRAQTRQYSHSAPHIQLDLPDVMPPLPAAVEVGVYRIIQEALTNVVRHADARRCTIRLEVDAMLEVEILDDGKGFPATPQAGVGMASMRERAAELGGSCTIEPGQTSGVRVRARLPLALAGGGADDREA